MFVVAGALSAAAAAQTPQPPPVRLDVAVFDARGRFVDSLDADDFEVLEGDSPRRIDEVRLVAAGGAADAGEMLQPIASAADEQFQAARDGTRLFAIYLDEYHVTPGAAAARARELLTAFLEQAIGPRDLVLVVKPLDSLVRLRMTRDRDAVRRAVASFEGRKGDYEPRSSLERSLIAGNPARIDAARAQVSLSALNAIATHLGGLSATRKALLVIGEGFGASARRRSAAALPSIDTVIRSANRGMVSIYTLDPRPSAAAAGDAGHATLLRLAGETDGHAMLTPPTAAAGLDRLIRDSSRYYLLTLEGADDGRFHAVEVRVRTPGLQVRARTGFWAASADELHRLRLTSAAAPPPPLLLPRRASPLIRPWFGIAPRRDGKPQVSFVWEPANRVPGDAAGRARPARILLKARTSDGTVIYEGAARPASAAIGGSGTPAQLLFTAPPGRLHVEMAIEDAASRLVDTDVRDVVVDVPKGPVALGTPRILRSRTAREHRTVETDPEAVPTPSRQFSRIERLWVRVPVYSTATQPRVGARLMSAIGGAMRELAVAAVPAGAAPSEVDGSGASAVEGMYQIDLPLAGLPSGDYSVEFAAAGGGAEVKEVVSFRVTP